MGAVAARGVAGSRRPAALAVVFARLCGAAVFLDRAAGEVNCNHNKAR